MAGAGAPAFYCWLVPTVSDNPSTETETPLGEADTRAKLITPALKRRGWDEELIRREFPIKRGRLYTVGNKAVQKAPVFADYLLSMGGLPVAVLEAKEESLHVAAGLQQSKNYAKLLDLRFAYSSNGNQFVEFDFVENTERLLELDAFPTPGDLAEKLRSQGLLPPAGDPLVYPYNTSGDRQPRYYQDVAVRRSLTAIANGRKRLLLSLATGTGKTYISAQLAWKLYRTERIKRVLFLADRIFLRDQASGSQTHHREVAQPDPSDTRAYVEQLTKAVFIARLNWKVVENKWPGLLEAFHGFDPEYVANLSPKQVEAIAENPAVIRNGSKIEATVENANVMLELVKGERRLSPLPRLAPQSGSDGPGPEGAVSPPR